MKIKMIGLYGIDKPTNTAYFRKQGQFGFDFVDEESLATELTAEETVNIIKHKRWYIAQYRAKDLIIV